ncbi:uncharacterized protein [Drosophila bipectinata]|uniref:uncharacterized protein n=1 Tax=Drosophila bipectinata TaxID=42026 RepID=UPI0038B3B7F3
MAIEHCKGTENVVADPLSRMLEAVEEPEDDWMLRIQTTAFESPDYVKLGQMLESEKETFPDIKVVDGYVFKRTEDRTAAELEENTWKLWVPASLSVAMIDQAHSPPNKAHGGMGKTLHRFRQRFYWTGMVAQVRGFVRDCRICKETKPTNRPAARHRSRAGNLQAIPETLYRLSREVSEVT